MNKRSPNDSFRISRRQFLRVLGIAASGAIVFGPHAWASRSSNAFDKRGRLVVVLLRGAVDGLNVVVPYNEANYYEYRPSIAIPRIGEGAVLDLDGDFGLTRSDPVAF